MCKGSPKTMRFDTEVEKIIEEFRGNNFSEKFHNLVYHYKKTVPQREQQLKNLEKQIQEKRKKLQELNTKTQDINWLVNSMDNLKDSLKYVNRRIEDVLRQ